MTTSRRWTRRWIALGVGVLLTPLVLEGALRVAARIVRESRAGAKGTSLALCQGDSFTFGLFLPPEASYPARLETLMREHGAPDARIVNCGIPSKPTWVVKRELRQDLADYRPKFALLLAGINDHWRQRPDDHEVEGAAAEEWRVVRTWRWMAARFGAEDAEGRAPADRGETPASKDRRVRGGNWMRPHEIEQHTDDLRTVHFKDRLGNERSFEILTGEPQESEYTVWIREDMTRAVGIARAEGVEPILLSYPATGRPFDAANDALQATAESTGARFIDLRPTFREALALVGRDALFFPDQHTTALGCDLMARVVLDRLGQEGLVKLDSLPPVLGGLSAVDGDKELRVELVLADGRPDGVRASYQTGYGAVLLLSLQRGSTPLHFTRRACLEIAHDAEQRAHSTDVPLETDKLLFATLNKDEDRTHTIGGRRLGRPEAATGQDQPSRPRGRSRLRLRGRRPAGRRPDRRRQRGARSRPARGRLRQPLSGARSGQRLPRWTCPARCPDSGSRMRSQASRRAFGEPGNAHTTTPLRTPARARERIAALPISSYESQRKSSPKPGMSVSSQARTVS